MAIYITKRIFKGIVLLLIVSVLVFLIISLIPGNGIESNISPTTSKEKIEMQRQYLNLDKPILNRFIIWITKISQGDFGYSFSYKMPANSVIVRHMYPTVLLGIFAMILQLVIGIPIGILGASYKGWGKFANVLSLISLSLPVFFVGLILKNILSLKLMVLPLGGLLTTGKDGSALSIMGDMFIHLILPSFVLAFGSIGPMVRYTKFFMTDVLNQDFVVLAKAKGLPKSRIIYKHCVRNLLLPLVTIVGISLPALFVGSYIVEELFSINGMGKLALNSFMARDYNLIMAYTMVLAALIIFCNLITDVLYKIIDKRVKMGEKYE